MSEALNVRLIDVEGVTWKNWVIPKFQDPLFVAVAKPLEWTRNPNPAETTLAHEVAEFRFERLLGPEDGGPLAIYRRVK